MIPLTAAFGAGIAVLVVAGCAGHPEPIVDLKGIDPEVFQQDLEECRVYAGQVDVGTAAAKGGTVGAVVGAAAGAIGGDAGAGAGYGGIYGATTSGLGADHEKRAVFARCLEGRGYRVLNHPAPHGPAGAPRYGVFTEL